MIRFSLAARGGSTGELLATGTAVREGAGGKVEVAGGFGVSEGVGGNVSVGRGVTVGVSVGWGVSVTVGVEVAIDCRTIVFEALEDTPEASTIRLCETTKVSTTIAIIPSPKPKNNPNHFSGNRLVFLVEFRRVGCGKMAWLVLADLRRDRKTSWRAVRSDGLAFSGGCRASMESWRATRAARVVLSRRRWTSSKPWRARWLPGLIFNASFKYSKLARGSATAARINQGSSCSGASAMARWAQARAACFFPRRSSFKAIWMADLAVSMFEGIIQTRSSYRNQLNEVPFRMRGNYFHHEIQVPD